MFNVDIIAQPKGDDIIKKFIPVQFDNFLKSVFIKSYINFLIVL